MSTISRTARSSLPTLYRWQFDALVDWLRCGRRGVIEAVTGSGKTDVAIAACADAMRRGQFVLVLVPSRVLLEQWHDRLVRAFPGVRVGRLGDDGRDQPSTCDLLVATRHSAAAHRPVPPDGRGGLLVVDECHGLGGRVLRRALLPQYNERLGLTATLERSDDAVSDLLLPFFGGICHRYGFAHAIADGVCAAPLVAFVGVPLSAKERAEYIATESQLVAARLHLRSIRAMPLEPFGAFLAAVAHLADNDSGIDGRAAREYLDAFSQRRQIVAQSSGKYDLLGNFANTISSAEGALVFTETVRAANHAINRLDPLVRIELITGSTARRKRADILGDLRQGRLDAVAAPRVLDEGIDVPDANLGVVMSASRTRRQMIQRMGRILRRKRAGVAARFVIMYAKDTMEDPASRMERDGFLDEIERIAMSAGVFDSVDFARLEAFLAQPGPTSIVEPERIDDRRLAFAELHDDTGHYALGATGHLPGDEDATTDARVAQLVARYGAEPVYVYATMAGQALPSTVLQSIDRVVAPRLAVFDADAEVYLEPELTALPELTVPKTPPKRLSTGETPLEIVTENNAWHLRCMGCAAVSSPVRFRWQVFDQTVPCECAS